MATIVGGGKTSVNEQKIKGREIVLMRTYFVMKFIRNLYMIYLTGIHLNNISALLNR